MTSPWPCPRTCGWSGRATASTATGRPTSPCSWPRARACRRGTSPTTLAARLRAVAGVRSVDVAGPGVPQHHPRRRLGRRAGPHDRRGRAGLRARRRRGRARGSTSSSSPPTRPARSTSAAPAGPRSATPWPGVLEAAGAEVTREYYFNDHGAQIDRFAALAAGRRQGRAGPEDGYAGDYIADIATAGAGERARHPRPAGRPRRRRLPRRSAST